MTTFVTAITDIAKKIAAAEGEDVASGTLTGGTVTTLIDTDKLKDSRTGADDTHYVDVWVRIYDDSATAVQKRLVITYDPSAGELTWSGNLDADVEDDTDTYTLHFICHPDVVEDAINEVLRTSRYPTFYLLTQVPDGDMEDSAATSSPLTNWTESGSQTPTKDTTIVRHGIRSLKIDQNSRPITEYVASDAIPVVEYESWDVIATLKCTTGGGKLVAYDNTSGAEIDSWTADETAWTEVGEPFTIPSGCESLVFRLYGTTTSSVVYWDSVWAKKVEDEILDLPSWITKRKHIKEIFYYPAGHTRTNDSRSVRERRPIPINDWNWQQDETAATPWRIEINDNSRRPIYLDCRRPYAELSADADTTTMDRQLLVTGALMVIYRDKGKDFEDEYRRRRDEYYELAGLDSENRPQVEMISAYSPYR
jgi:hypothetical protein